MFVRVCECNTVIGNLQSSKLYMEAILLRIK